MVKSRFGRWFIVAVYGAVMMAALFAAIILFYDTHYRVARVLEKRPEFFVALGYGFFLSYGVRRRLYTRRKSTRWVAAWWALMGLVPIAAMLYATGWVRVPTEELLRVAVFLVLGVALGLFGAVYALMDDRGPIATGRARHFKNRRGDWGWGAIFAASIALLTACGLLLAEVMEGGWAAHRGTVLSAAMFQAMTAGFLAVRLFAERSSIETSGFRLAAGTLLFILALLIFVVVRDGRHDATGELLAIAAGMSVTMTAFATWPRGYEFRWLGLAPVDDDHHIRDRYGRRKSLRELRRLNAWILRHPLDSSALAERSKLLLSRGEASRALADLDQAIQVDPKKAHHFLYLKHLVRLSHNDHAQAMQDILSAIENDDSRRERYYEAAALVYVQWGRIDGVAAMLEKLGLPVSRVPVVRAAALRAALSLVDQEIAGRISRMSDRPGADYSSELDSLRQTRADLVAKLKSRPAAPSDVQSGL